MTAEIHRPQDLPFLEALCWDLRDINQLSQDEMLDRYERGWDFRGVLADITPQEAEFIFNLAKAKGSWLQTSVST